MDLPTPPRPLTTEPQLPACHLCGSISGPWLPDPSGARWPSGAQMLICSRRCNGEQDGGAL